MCCSAGILLNSKLFASCKNPVFGLADLNRQFRVFYNASDTAIGAVLLQPDDHGDWHPIGFTSRRLRPEEKNYTMIEKETLAAIHALRTWRHYQVKTGKNVRTNQGQLGCDISQI